MFLSTQLKRGYLALLGMFAIGWGLALAPEVPVRQHAFAEQGPAVAKDCKIERRGQWILSSTPLDMPNTAMLRIRLCRA